MNNIKEKYYDFVVTDFDGTLANTKKEITPKTLKVIENFIKNGGVFSVCTGRMSGAILPILRRYNMRGYYICYNGAEICDIESGEKIYTDHVDCSACVKILKYAEDNNLDVIVYPDDMITVNNVSENIGGYVTLDQQNCRITTEKLSFIYKRENLTSGKVLVFADKDENSNLKIIDDIRKLIGEDYNIGRSNLTHIDITKKSATKGNAIEKLSKITGKTMDKLICFGDELNDRTMLEKADFAVVTANCNPLMKEFADYITDSSDEDGVGNAMEKFCI